MLYVADWTTENWNSAPSCWTGAAMIDACGLRQRLLTLLLLLLFHDIYPATLHTYTHGPYIYACRAASLVCLGVAPVYVKEWCELADGACSARTTCISQWAVASTACRSRCLPCRIIPHSRRRSQSAQHVQRYVRVTVAATRPSRAGVLASANFLESFPGRGALRYLHQTIRTTYGPLKMQSRFAPIFPSFLPQTSDSRLLSLNKSPVSHSSRQPTPNLHPPIPQGFDQRTLLL